MLALLEKATTAPQDVSADDVPQGLEREAMLDALHVNFGFQLASHEQLLKGTKSLHRFGYRFPGFLTGPTTGATTCDRHDRLTDNLRTAVFDSPGTTDPATRRAVASGEPADALWASYAAKVREASFRVTDTDIADLKAATPQRGRDHEITAAAAVGAALRSLDAGRHAVPQG